MPFKDINPQGCADTLRDMIHLSSRKPYTEHSAHDLFPKSSLRHPSLGYTTYDYTTLEYTTHEYTTLGHTAYKYTAHGKEARKPCSGTSLQGRAETPTEYETAIEQEAVKHTLCTHPLFRFSSL